MDQETVVWPLVWPWFLRPAIWYRHDSDRAEQARSDAPPDPDLPMPLLLAVLATLLVASPGHAEEADLAALFAAAGVEATFLTADLDGDPPPAPVAVAAQQRKNPRPRIKSSMCLRFLPCTALAVAADQSSSRALLPRLR